MSTFVDPDGTIIHKGRPKDDVPFYADWLDLLLSREAARLERDASGVERIQPFDRFKEQATHLIGGQVKVICIGCGKPTTFMEMAKIRIGGLVQFPTREQRPPVAGQPDEFDVKYRVQPVSKTGLGCKACQARMAEATAMTDRDNSARAARATAQASIGDARQRAAGITFVGDIKAKCLHGYARAFCAVCNRRPSTMTKRGGFMTMPTPRVPYIDVLGES